MLARPTQIATPEYQQPERPKQIYNQGSYSTNNAPQIKQPNSQIATNIDTSSIYINKNTYEDKNKGYVTQTVGKINYINEKKLSVQNNQIGNRV